MSIGIIDVGIGNLGSLRHAVQSQGWDTVNVSTPDDFAGLTHLFLPGVGAFASAMARLDEAGIIEPIRKFAASGLPIMGICLGMQILAEKGLEGGDTLGLALIPGEVHPIKVKTGMRLPHVGWNELRKMQAHPLLKGIRNDVDFYFVHSYRFVASDIANVLAETEYGDKFPSLICKDNVVGAQFHPEKSQINGLRLLDNFCLWDGKC